MRSKDRLAELRHAAESAGTGTGTGTGTGAGEPAPAPQHARDIDNMLLEVERMRGWIHEVNNNSQLLRRLHCDPTFHTNKQLQEQLDAAVAASGAVGARVCAALRDFERHCVRGAGAGAGAVPARVARLQYACTRALYADALAAQHAALAALRDTRARLLRDQLHLTNLSVSEEECERLLESRNLSLFVDNVAADAAAARRALRDAEVRGEELARAEASLRDVRDLFHQLALLVAAQQEQVDSVEYYALQATELVECGGEQLLKGTVSRSRAGKKKMSLIICMAAGAFVVLLVLVCT